MNERNRKSSVVTQHSTALRDDTKNGWVGDFPLAEPQELKKWKRFSPRLRDYWHQDDVFMTKQIP